MHNFKIGDRVSVSDYYDNRHGMIIDAVNEKYIRVEFDEPKIIESVVIHKHTFHYSKLKLLEKRERTFNLDLDPFGEENW